MLGKGFCTGWGRDEIFLHDKVQSYVELVFKPYTISTYDNSILYLVFVDMSMLE